MKPYQQKLYDFKQATEDHGLSHSLFVYITTIANELHDPDGAAVFQIATDEARHCVVKSLSSDNEFTFLHHDLADGQPRTVADEDALMESFDDWCMENCASPQLQIAFDMVSLQAHQAVNQLRREQFPDSGPHPDPAP